MSKVTDGGTNVLLPLNTQMTEILKRLLYRAVTDGYGQIEITITPQMVKIVDRTEHRLPWV